VEVGVDLPERLEVVVDDVRSVVRCRYCGFKTGTVHDRRRVRVTWVTRRLARSLVRGVSRLPIREPSRRWGLGWHFIMDLVASWSTRVVAERRQRRCRVLMVDETSLRRRHRYVTVLINGETGQGLVVVKHRDANARNGFLAQQGHRWLKGVRVVVTDGSESYRPAIRAHLGHATHVVDRFHVARWFASGLIEVRRRIQRIGPKGSRPAYNPEIFRSRCLQLRREDRLEPETRARLETILATDPDLAQAWEPYQALHRIYLAEDDQAANQAPGEFIERHYTRSLPEFEPLLDTLLEWGDEISAFHDANRAISGRLEGTNAKLGVLRGSAYGFVSATNSAHRAPLLTPGARSGIMTPPRRGTHPTPPRRSE